MKFCNGFRLFKRAFRNWREGEISRWWYFSELNCPSVPAAWDYEWVFVNGEWVPCEPDYF